MKNYLIALFLLLLASCGKDTPPEPEPVATPAMPITEVQQTLNISAAQAWENLLTVLNQREIGTELVYKELGRITTAWVPMQDSLCDLFDSEQAPLSCRTQYSIHVQPLSATASSVSIRYTEKCLGREEMELVCPGSNAEQRMIAIIEDLKALAGIAS